MREKRRLSRHDTYEDLSEFIEHWVDLVSASCLPEDAWITGTEKLAFASFVIMASEGISLSSREAVLKLSEMLNINDGYVYKIRGELRKKGWLIQTPEGDVLPGEFDVSDGIPTELDFVISMGFKTEQDDTRAKDNGSGGEVLSEPSPPTGHIDFAPRHEGPPSDGAGDVGRSADRLLADRF